MLLNLRIIVNGALLSLLLTGTITAPIWAEGDLSGVPWDQLGAEEQTVLTPFKEQWKNFPPTRQRRLQNGASRYLGMTPNERRGMHNRFKRWKSLPLEKQERIRQQFKAFRQLSPNKRRAIREKRRWFRDLPKERRQELRKRWKNLPPEKRHKIRKRMRKAGGRPYRFDR